eukprot:scaffold161736_cov98-Cyclotella_meneghiniana.AAC.3
MTSSHIGVGSKSRDFWSRALGIDGLLDGWTLIGFGVLIGLSVVGANEGVRLDVCDVVLEELLFVGGGGDNGV